MMAIKKCSCVSAYQDKKYGAGNRVHNPTQKGKGGTPIWRCTVCGKENT